MATITREDLYHYYMNVEDKLGWQNVRHDDYEEFERKITLRNALRELIDVMREYDLDALPTFE